MCAVNFPAIAAKRTAELIGFTIASSVVVNRITSRRCTGDSMAQGNPPCGIRVQAAMADIRWAFRLLRRHPAFSATVILTLAGAIAAVATSFGIATAVLWRPLPFADADRLVFLWENTAGSGGIEPARVTTYR